MTYEEKVDWLLRYARLCAAIRTAREEYRELLTQAAHITPTLTFEAHGTRRSDKPARFAELRWAKQEEIRALSRRAETAMAEIMQVTSALRLSDPERTASAKKLLRCRYLAQLTREAEAAEVGYTVRHCRNLHAEAVEHLTIPEDGPEE